MTLHRRFQTLGMVLLTAVLLGCGSNGDGTETDDAAQRDDTVEAVATGQASAPEVEVMSEPVDVDIAAELDNRRQMQIHGDTNLPEGTRLQIVVERESSRVSWRSGTNVDDNGSFEAGPFGPGSGLPDGIYLIEITAPPANVQPLSVRERVGERGEHLSGEWVREANHGLGNEVRYQVRVELVDQRTIRAVEDGS